MLSEWQMGEREAIVERWWKGGRLVESVTEVNLKIARGRRWPIVGRRRGALRTVRALLMARLIAAIKAMDIDAVEEILDGTADPEAPLPEPGRYHVMSLAALLCIVRIDLAEPSLWETPTVGNGDYKLILYRLLEWRRHERRRQ